MPRLGVDLIEIERIEEALARWQERFLQRVYTAGELEICQQRVPALAVRFAGKEAVMKLLGTGVKGVGWKEIEILALESGKPVVHLHDRALQKAIEMGISQIEISLSHSRQNALAAALG